MKPLTQHTGIVVPLDRANVDTDVIIPKQFLKSIRRTGFGVNLFDEWRYLDHGEPGQDCSKRPVNQSFVLNRPDLKGASILLARANFGCGSSREHAPWALEQYGFRVLLASSFADIFFHNCFKNGLLPIVLSEADIERLFVAAHAAGALRLEVDLQQQTVRTLDGAIEIGFDVDPFRKECLLNGFDDIALTLRQTEAIRGFEQQHMARFPWLANAV
ncbi:3-isopropylmalate dehydratase small subunit [Pandoraea sp.]|uniref:3-isopropylmalate dehydratase small subunit n=1 Tax=Pandoraea sp. TaxID=1883445 RepID=UPI0011F7E924|nr:3-isopropylmalate dehydratase small subunit [Pandoraea sp.]TAL52304.1 MAG: 3-isopropylmalate dehydratase small subunit [Pandoraea sp.]TAM16114.1 MAG: 3-isopropylmalate dehydratase small subunit [Pandoraea sp.]